MFAEALSLVSENTAGSSRHLRWRAFPVVPKLFRNGGSYGVRSMPRNTAQAQLRVPFHSFPEVSSSDVVCPVFFPNGEFGFEDSFSRGNCGNVLNLRDRVRALGKRHVVFSLMALNFASLPELARFVFAIERMLHIPNNFLGILKRRYTPDVRYCHERFNNKRSKDSYKTKHVLLGGQPDSSFIRQCCNRQKPRQNVLAM